MKWTRLELAVLARISKYPWSMTPRECAIKLTTLRTLWVSVSFLVIGVIAFGAGALTALPGLPEVGIALYLLGLCLLLISMLLMLVVIVIFGD